MDAEQFYSVVALQDEVDDLGPTFRTGLPTPRGELEQVENTQIVGEKVVG